VRLYIHCGVQRTATTSIQRFMNANHDALTPKGLLYPFRVERHWDFVNQFHRNPDRREFLMVDLMRRAQANPHEIHTICMSEEDIFWRRGVEWMAPLLDKFDLRVVVFLRRQDLWLESWYFQHIKWQWLADTAHARWDAFRQMEEHFFWIDYRDTIQRLEKVVGRERIVLRVFERAKMPEGPIACFLEAVGMAGFPSEAKLENASLPPLLSEFMRRLPLEETSDRMKILLEEAMADMALQASDFPPEAFSSLLFSAEERAAFMDGYAEGNAWIAKEYFGAETLFDDPLPAADAPVNPMRLPQETEVFMEKIMDPFMRRLLARLGTELP